MTVAAVTIRDKEYLEVASYSMWDPKKQHLISLLPLGLLIMIYYYLKK